MPADLRPPLPVLFNAFGVPATFTPLNGDPIEDEGVWFSMAPSKLRAYQPGFDQEVADLRPRFLFKTSVVPDLPPQSTIQAPELLGGTVKTWIVDWLDNPDDPEVREAVVHEQM